MRWFQWIVCCAVIVVWVGIDFGENVNLDIIFTGLLCAFLFIFIKDDNLRQLLVITTLINLIFYEIDTMIMVLIDFNLSQPATVTDLTLNAFIIINQVILIYAIFYRQEITNHFCKLFDLPAINYVPTVGDYIYIKMYKVLFVLHILGTIGLLILAIKVHLEPDGSVERNQLFDTFFYYSGQYAVFAGLQQLLLIIAMLFLGLKVTKRQVKQERIYIFKG